MKSLNATFLVLLPRKGEAKDSKDFKPISLVGSLYKLLANRLKKNGGQNGLQIIECVCGR